MQTDVNEIIADLKNRNVASLTMYARANAEEITSLYQENKINDELIYGVLKHVIINQARSDYNVLLRPTNTNFADDVGFPECFAYALKNGVFSKDELAKIPFESGDSIDKYVAQHFKPDLFNTLKENLLHPPKSLLFDYKDDNDDYDPHPVCSCD